MVSQADHDELTMEREERALRLALLKAEVALMEQRAGPRLGLSFLAGMALSLCVLACGAAFSWMMAG